eukprot:gene9490-6660_t
MSSRSTSPPELLGGSEGSISSANSGDEFDNSGAFSQAFPVDEDHPHGQQQQQQPAIRGASGPQAEEEEEEDRWAEGHPTHGRGESEPILSSSAIYLDHPPGDESHIGMWSVAYLNGRRFYFSPASPWVRPNEWWAAKAGGGGGGGGSSTTGNQNVVLDAGGLELHHGAPLYLLDYTTAWYVRQEEDAHAKEGGSGGGASWQPSPGQGPSEPGRKRPRGDEEQVEASEAAPTPAPHEMTDEEQDAPISLAALRHRRHTLPPYPNVLLGLPVATFRKRQRGKAEGSAQERRPIPPRWHTAIFLQPHHHYRTVTLKRAPHERVAMPTWPPSPFLPRRRTQPAQQQQQQQRAPHLIARTLYDPVPPSAPAQPPQAQHAPPPWPETELWGFFLFRLMGLHCGNEQREGVTPPHLLERIRRTRTIAAYCCSLAAVERALFQSPHLYPSLYKGLSRRRLANRGDAKYSDEEEEEQEQEQEEEEEEEQREDNEEEEHAERGSS